MVTGIPNEMGKSHDLERGEPCDSGQRREM